MSYKVLLTTSGTGSRLGPLTQSTNKSLVEVGGKATLCRIIEAYPSDTVFVVTLGYLGDQVKTFLETTYPDRTFEYVWVEPYQGAGSSLGYSMLQARSLLACPFIFHACDTIVIEPIPAPDMNWVGGKVVGSEPFDQYRTHLVEGGRVKCFQDKGVAHADSVHIGLIGIKDHEVFWKVLERQYRSHPEDSTLSDVSVLTDMLNQGVSFAWIPYTVWLDTGNPQSLAETRAYFS